jgi:hypothetical protein
MLEGYEGGYCQTNVKESGEGILFCIKERPKRKISSSMNPTLTDIKITEEWEEGATHPLYLQELNQSLLRLDYCDEQNKRCYFLIDDEEFEKATERWEDLVSKEVDFEEPIRVWNMYIPAYFLYRYPLCAPFEYGEKGCFMCQYDYSRPIYASCA